ncbi:MAG: AI-2E family transporter [Rhodothermales bacterium]|nr:AI-2E family transporter [Rhodothermales bacterium]MBO6779082.1 AI-2E family transporter [Rhodothermales bacterium]
MIPEQATPTAVSRITPERVVRWVVYAVLGIGALLLAWYFARLLVYLVIGIALAYIMRPLKDWVQSFGFSSGASLVLTFVSFLGLVGLLLTYLVPFAAGQITEVSQTLSPDNVARTVAERIALWLPVDAQRVRDGMFSAIDTLVQEDRLTAMAGSVLDLFANIFYAVLVIPFVAFFFLKDGSRIRSSLLQMIPNKYFEISLGIVEKVETSIGRYFRALFLQSLSIASIATLLLWVVGLDYALAVGIFAGLANTIPYFGPIIGLLAGAVVGISQTGDFSLFLGVLIAMGITQLTDNLVLQPLIFSKAARAHPLVILFVVLIGAQLAGILGMLVAIPLTTTLAVLVREILWSMRTYRNLRVA